MYYVREKVLQREFMAGTWCSLGCPAAAEIAGLAGYDWALLDNEHSPTTVGTLMAQMQAMQRTSTAPVVRIPWLDRVYIKWALDIGASGIMVPYVETEAQAQEAVSFMRYPPAGTRGVAGATRCSDYGYDFKNYFVEANRQLLTIVQVETGQAVENAPRMAAVDGVDVLFVGPMDLSNSIGMPKRFEDPAFVQVLRQVSDAARNAGKACGILLPDTALVPMLRDLGYTFIAVSSDVNILARHWKDVLQKMRG